MNAARSNDPARQERLRALNLELVFRHVLAADAPVSRTELAAATGLTRPTITRIVEELIAGRLVTETGATPDGRAGRPRMGLTLSRSGPAGLGLDIRTDGLAACVVDLSGTVRYLAYAPCDDTEAPAVLERLGRMATEAAEAAAAEGLTVVTATLAVPGPTDDGIVRTAPSLDWRDVDAGALLAEHLRHLDLPTNVDNEANLAARGELHRATPDHFLYISGGLDIGAGIILDRRLMRGSHGWGGELGHVTVDPDGKPCRCGSRGCLQTYASLAAILDGQTLPDGLTADAALLTWADAGRPETIAALDTAATALGIAIANVLNLLDIDTVLLGGSFALLSSWLITGVETEINQRVLSARWAPITVRPATLGPDAAAIGAAMAVVDRIRRDPTAWLASGR
ncbi:ROK family transcriptional regulator [Glycomyces algeriensis]|uniref:Sugar kinase n=1 Tax=Glycomyces algeriensis TaxID=256037 RepID=A0A9W6LEP3_9ACTN|nr:ROK family transcriptional regulator [Glycomyces algeriensis]MDA1368069.1 ROK family transcriptional regulator [Glycomyces algeriensis]MDR7352581.1 putative NBD/HSP70 family sugar kinase [Glycomyces algeriensis]GLI40260.1 sugar kinase [Glycomyces algeriensis]